MDKIFNDFKKYLINLDSKQIDTKGSEADVKLMDLLKIKEIVNHMKLVRATEKEEPLLQYGTFFDGERLFYNDEVFTLNQETFNHAILNHIFHFMNGAQFLLAAKATNNRMESYRSTVALYFAHFNISGVLPKYARSTRSKWFTKYHKPGKGYGLIFTPHQDTANYFYEEYEKGNINLPRTFGFKVESRFNGPEGIIYISRHKLPFLRLTGIEFDRYESRDVVLLKEEDGSYTRVSLMNKKAKELAGYREVMESLAGDLGEW